MQQLQMQGKEKNVLGFLDYSMGKVELEYHISLLKAFDKEQRSLEAFINRDKQYIDKSIEDDTDPFRPIFTDGDCGCRTTTAGVGSRNMIGQQVSAFSAQSKKMTREKSHSTLSKTERFTQLQRQRSSPRIDRARKYSPSPTRFKESTPRPDFLECIKGMLTVPYLIKHCEKKLLTVQAAINDMPTNTTKGPKR